MTCVLFISVVMNPQNKTLPPVKSYSLQDVSNLATFEYLQVQFIEHVSVKEGEEFDKALTHRLNTISKWYSLNINRICYRK